MIVVEIDSVVGYGGHRVDDGRRPVEEGATATDAHESVITLAT